MNENFRLLKPFFRGLPIIVVAMILGVLVAKKYLSYVTPKYEATSKIKLADVHDGVSGSNLFKDFDVFATSNKIAAEIELIKSELLVEKAISNLSFETEIYRVGKVRSVELYNESPILISHTFKSDKLLDKTYQLTINNNKSYAININNKNYTGTIGEPLVGEFGTMLITLNKSLFESKTSVDLADKYEIKFLSRENLIKKIIQNLDINPIDKDVAVIRITYQSPVKEKAAVLVNKLAEAYIKDYIETKYKAAGTTVSFLDNQITGITEKLNSSENNIENYRDEESITNIRQETETDLRSLAQMKIQLSNEKMTVDAMIDLVNYIKSGKDRFLELAPNFEAFTDLLSTEIVKNIKQLQAEKKDLLLTYTPEEEKVKVIDKKIDDLKAYLIESINNTLKNHQVKYARLQREITEVEKKFIGIPGKEKHLNSLNRDFELYQKSYNFLNEKKIEAEIAQAAKISFHRIIEHAITPTNPISPNRGIIIIVSAILGMVGSIIIIYSVHAAKAKVNDVYTIEKNSALPVVFPLPRLLQLEEAKQTFHNFALQLELKNLLNQSVIAVSSFSPNEGKRYIINGIAKELATQNKKVLVVSLGEKTENLLHNNIKYIHLTTDDLKGINAETFGKMVDLWKHEADVVLIKNDNVLTNADSLLSLHVADTNLFIFDSRKTPATSIHKAELLKEEYAINKLYVVLNQAGYNPNIVKQIWQLLSMLINKIKHN